MKDDELILRRKRQNADRARAYRKRKKDLDAMPSTSTVQSDEPVSENSAKLLHLKQLNAERCRRYRQKCKRLKSSANFNQGTSDSDTSTSRDTSRNLPIIARIYLYLEKEYEYMKSLNGDICDLSPLADILKRTADATGTSEENVITILETEDLSHHLPERAKTKRKKMDKDNSELNRTGSNDSCGTLDTSWAEVKVELNHDETMSANRLFLEVSPLGKTTGSNDNGELALMTLDTSRTQVKVELNDDETMSVNRLFLEVSPLDRTSVSVKSIRPGAEGTEVKLEDEDDPLRQIYCNRYEDDMEIENHTFIISTPNYLTSTSDATKVTIKLEPQDDDCI